MARLAERATPWVTCLERSLWGISFSRAAAACWEGGGNGVAGQPLGAAPTIEHSKSQPRHVGTPQVRPGRIQGWAAFRSLVRLDVPGRLSDVLLAGPPARAPGVARHKRPGCGQPVVLGGVWGGGRGPALC